MLDELRQIAIFAKTVDYGSFRSAAKALDLSPSVVSHHVSQLEKRLGTALLYRSTRKISLTSDGELLLAAAHAMLEAAESGIQDIVSHTPEPAGQLRITAPAFLAQSALSDAFASFSIDYPLVALSIDYTDTRRNLIAEGYDVALSAGELLDSSLKARTLFEVQRRLTVASRVLEIKKETPKNPRDLYDWEWVLLGPVRGQKINFRNGRKTVSITKPTSRMSVNNVHALCHLVKAGAGLALIPEFIAQREVDAGNLQYVLPNWTVDPIRVSALWPANAPKHGLVKRFVDYIANAPENPRPASSSRNK